MPARKRSETTGITGITLVNPGMAGVVYDLEGHSLGGGERVTVAALDRVGQHAVDTGQLLVDTWSESPADGTMSLAASVESEPGGESTERGTDQVG